MKVRRLLERLANSAIGAIGLHVSPQATFERLRKAEIELLATRQGLARAEVFSEVMGGSANLNRILNSSRSQLGQDIFALGATGFKREGFFVEFGACDGLQFSNTWALEKDFGWTGILSEPNPAYHEALAKNRSCTVETRAVSAETGQRRSFFPAGVNGSFFEFRNKKRWASATQFFEVRTVSLNDLLKDGHAPQRVDFLSIDTEGSELEILSNFDFSLARFTCITVELNKNGPAIQSLLESHGYTRVWSHLSQWDGWFIDTEIPLASRLIPSPESKS